MMEAESHRHVSFSLTRTVASARRLCCKQRVGAWHPAVGCLAGQLAIVFFLQGGFLCPSKENNPHSAKV